MIPIQTVSHGLLGEILRRQPPSDARTAFAWQVAVGPALARATRVHLAAGRLTVRSLDPRWVTEIAAARDIVLRRLQQLLGADAVTTLSIEQGFFFNEHP